MKSDNMRPRGLDAVLGHLLAKRMPVMHKLSSTKDTWIFNSKVDTRSSKARKAPNDPKLENHQMTPNWTLQALKTYLWGWNFCPFCSLNTAFRDIKVTKNRKCTEWRQNELKRLTVKSTLYTLNTYPCSPNFHAFCSTISGFQGTRPPKIRNAPNDPKLNLNT